MSFDKPIRVPLVVEPENRGAYTSRDAKIVNAFIERQPGGEVHVYRRPGLLQWTNPSGTTGAGQGVFWWNGNVYSIFAGSLYKNNSNTPVGTGMDTTGGVYSFSSIMGSDPKLVMQNGVKAYAYDDTAGLSTDLYTSSGKVYPEYTCKGLVYLDGAMYVMQHFYGTAITPATIWGSVPNSVTGSSDWDPLDFITAQIEPDSGVYLAKQQIYVVALKEWTTEFFFDAGNSTGSPLQFYPALKQGFGCASQDSIQNIKDVLFWLANSRSNSYQVCQMAAAQITIISTPSIDRLLNQVDLSTVYSWQVEFNGHSFYVLTIKSANLTIAYDIMQREWSQWTDKNGNYIPVVCSTRDSFGNKVLQNEADGFLYYCSPNYLTDNSDIIPVQVVTPMVDGGLSNKKMCGKTILGSDQLSAAFAYLQVSDDGYQSWSQLRTIDMSLNNPTLIHCGTFVNRAFKLTVNNNQPFRFKYLDLYVEPGDL